MEFIFSFLAFISLICLIVGWRNPNIFRAYLKEKTTPRYVKTFFSVTTLFLFFLVYLVSPKVSSDTANQTTAQAQPTSAPTEAPTATLEPTKPLSPTPTPSPVPTDINGFPMDADVVTVAQIAKVPSAYNQKKVTFTCSVSSFAKDNNGDAAAINCSDPNDISSIIQVSGSLFDFTKINQDDTVRIYGTGAGAATGKNAYGGDVTEGLVDGLFINDLTTGYKN